MEFSENYAHDLTDALKSVDNDSFHSIILNAFLAKYRFCYSDKDEYLLVTSVLLDKNVASSFSFQSRIESDPTIERKISYMLRGSGLWKRFIPSRKERAWLKNHKDDLSKKTLFYKERTKE